jgi:hypothetical protein
MSERAGDPTELRERLQAWLWWQMWNSPDLTRRVQCAHTYERLMRLGWRRGGDLAHRVINYWPMMQLAGILGTQRAEATRVPADGQVPTDPGVLGPSGGG